MPGANRSSSTSRVEYGDQLGGRALGDDHPAVHHHQPVAQLLGLVHVVRGDDLGDALALEPVQPVPQQVAGLRVEPGGRLVEQQQLGVVDQRPGDREPRFMPPDSGSTGASARSPSWANAISSAALLPRTRAGQAEVAAVDSRFSRTVSSVSRLSSCGTTPIRARIRGPSTSGVHAQHLQRAARPRRHAGDHPHRGRLARAVRTEEAEDLAARDVDVDAAHGLELAEALAQAAGLYETVPHTGTLTRGTDILRLPPRRRRVGPGSLSPVDPRSKARRDPLDPRQRWGTRA